MVNPQMARMASRSCHLSVKVLTTGGRGGVRRCKYREEFSITTQTAHLPPKLCRPCITIERNSCTERRLRRYISGKGKNVNDASDIDRAKFTHEVKIEVPDVGDDIECVIQKWHKKEGDLIKRDEVICDIRTKLFTFGMLTDDDYDSIMGKILIQEESDPIRPGTVICTTFDEGLGKEEEDR
ncbi:hypothetical protein ACHAXA_000671 [Cyclostephanos tholiformis]|uniref:Lipoyl-binding domain-containing protein n=1 Tax=Cyclostephanos tholiformis TaxID=382380 RepID=A0ABD3SCG8_9STRA